jgi:tetratricopeptide (TPR) repeat protein
MSRTDKYRCLYLAGGTATGLMVISIGAKSGMGPAIVSVSCLAAVTALATALQHHLWRDHFRGRQFFRLRKWSESADSSLAFIAHARIRPWVSRLVWLNYSVTSRDIIAVTQNNLASAYMALADFDRANAILDEALARDPLYPIPYLNRAKILLMQRRDAEARDALERCRRLGYRRTTWRALCNEVLPYRDGTQSN